MKSTFIKELSKLNNLHHINKNIYRLFLNRLKLGNLIQNQNPPDHFCSFFLPVNIKSKFIYMGHHIKANDWIPPGGHINSEESPLNTVYREFFEELRFKLTDQVVKLFDLTIKDVSGNPKHNCKIHYDFWYLVYTDKINFKFDRKEFYRAGWMTIDEALKKIKLEDYANVIRKLNGRV